MKLRERELSLVSRERLEYRELVRKIRDHEPGATTPGMNILCIGNAGGAGNMVCGRPAGGLLMRYAGRGVLIDPGSNSFRFLVGLGFDPYDITDVLASHAHDDHVGDLSVAVSAAVNLGLVTDPDSHILVCPSLVDYDSGQSTRYGFTLPAYAWKGRVEALYWRDIEVKRFDGARVQSRSRARVGEHIEVAAAEARHGSIMATGFVINTPMGRIGYTGDTGYFPELASWHDGADVLWMNLNTLALDGLEDVDKDVDPDIRPDIGQGIGRAATWVPNHLGYAGVCELIARVRPRTAIISHLGIQLMDRRQEIEDVLCERFSDTDIHCVSSGDVLTWRDTLSERACRESLTP